MENYYIGLISGTSMDGVDAVLCNIDHTQCTLLAHLCLPYPNEIYTGLQQLCYPTKHYSSDPIDDLGQLDQQLAEIFATATLSLCKQQGILPEHVRAIGCHGQTIRHRTEYSSPFSLQITNAAQLACLTQINVVSDFRVKDIALGGQGAPLAPIFHYHQFQHADHQRAIINIGGISNITILSKNTSNNAVIGYDTGPGNILMDQWINLHQRHTYDHQGYWASQGQVNRQVLSQLLLDPYLLQDAPKSTGIEYFNLSWLQQFTIGHISPVDLQATLAEFTALSIARELEKFAIDEIYLCGGGAKNTYLVSRLSQYLAPIPVQTTLTLGIDPDWIEACTFAWLAYAYYHQLPGNLPSVTGAKKSTILGTNTYFG